MNLIALLVTLLLLCVLVWAARVLMGAFGGRDPIKTVIYVVLVLIVVLWIVSALGLLPAGLSLRMR